MRAFVADDVIAFCCMRIPNRVVMKRDDALDALNGLAIIMVVMGRVMARCFPSGGVAFHMQLFLFVSCVLLGMSHAASRLLFGGR